ncbi:MAG: YbhB/YbcL family Raf kinase inhibitor-like protein [Acidimicrobiales bacterium]
MSRSSTLVVVAVVGALLAACQDDGRALDPAPTVPVSLETTTTIGPVAGPAVGTDVGQLTLASPAFVDGGPLPDDHTCAGNDVPPPLVIGDVPVGTVELAIVVTDRDAAGAVRWVVAGIPPTVTRLEPGALPPEAVTARAESGADGWEGPCPVAADPDHIHDFRVYAMTEPIGLAAGLEGRTAIDLIEQAATATGWLSATSGAPPDN